MVTAPVKREIAEDLLRMACWPLSGCTERYLTFDHFVTKFNKL